jgi:hypothetical protein
MSPLPKPVKRTPIWVCVLINQGAFPGMGTILAGQRSGYAQASIMVIGFLLVMGYMAVYLTAVTRYVMGGNAWTEADFHSKYRPYLWALYNGLGLCLVAWVWALFSSLAMWRKRNDPVWWPGCGRSSAAWPCGANGTTRCE